MMKNIHPTALVSNRATLGENVEIGPYTIVHDNVVLGNNVKIHAYCELGLPTELGDKSPLIIGDNSLVRSHSIFYESSVFKDELVTGHHVTVRENTKAGLRFQIGTASEIQGDCSIGDFVRFQSNVFVSKKTEIGNYVWVFPYVIFTNDPTPPSEDIKGCFIEDYASICANSIIMSGVKVGRGSLVCAGAVVTKNITPKMAVAGVPAKITGHTKNILRRSVNKEPAYPWTKHFHRGYPQELVDSWISGMQEVIDD